MANYIEVDNKMAFHPGYYIEEIIEFSNISQKDFAKKLDTTPKNISDLINGKQSLSIDIASKLSSLLGTSIEYWLNLQSAYDVLIGEKILKSKLEEEKRIFKSINYQYFKDNFSLPNLPRNIKGQIEAVRSLLKISSLTVLEKRDLAVNFRSSNLSINNSNIVKANIMVQLAINEALETTTEKYNKKKFEEAIDYALTITDKHKNFYELIKERFAKAGVILVALPNLPGSKINGATKPLNGKILLMVNDRRKRYDTFWFTLLHEAGHVINKDYGISFTNEEGNKEEKADRFARDKLIPKDLYGEFVKENDFSLASIKDFSKKINRDSNIILGRLKNDGYIAYNDSKYDSLTVKYKIH